MPRPCSARPVVKLQTQANLGQIVWSMEADILLSELFVLNTQILGIYIWLWKSLVCWQNRTMFPLQVGIIIKTNNQIIKINIRIFTIKSCRSVQAWRTSGVLNNWETNLVTLKPRSLAIIFHNMVISLGFTFGLRIHTKWQNSFKLYAYEKKVRKYCILPEITIW